MADKLTEERKEEIKKIFDTYDADGSGTITVEELGDVMRSLSQNPTKAELEDLIKKHDTEGNGTLDFQEFLTLMANNQKTEDEEKNEIKEAFRQFDLDGNGFISKTELIHVLSKMGKEPLSEEEAITLIRDCDEDGDGQISYMEFVEFMMNTD